MDSPALLGDRDARGRLPLRSRGDARARSCTTSIDCPRSSTSIQQDPVLNRTKLIAEPWDIGRRRLPGRQLSRRCGRSGTASYRDSRARLLARPATRRWRSSRSRLTGSSDLYQDDGRSPCASINFITAHDGFTLRDLVSATTTSTTRRTARRIATARATTDRGICGAEGPTDDAADQRAARAPAAQPRSRRCCCHRACRCSSAATRSAARRAATTTPTVRTTRLSWL